jgi:hypothetical protein
MRASSSLMTLLCLLRSSSSRPIVLSCSRLKSGMEALHRASGFGAYTIEHLGGSLRMYVPPFLCTLKRAPGSWSRGSQRHHFHNIAGYSADFVKLVSFTKKMAPCVFNELALADVRCETQARFRNFSSRFTAGTSLCQKGGDRGVYMHLNGDSPPIGGAIAAAIRCGRRGYLRHHGANGRGPGGLGSVQARVLYASS